MKLKKIKMNEKVAIKILVGRKITQVKSGPFDYFEIELDNGDILDLNYYDNHNQLYDNRIIKKDGCTIKLSKGR